MLAPSSSRQQQQQQQQQQQKRQEKNHQQNHNSHQQQSSSNIMSSTGNNSRSNHYADDALVVVDDDQQEHQHNNNNHHQYNQIHNNSTSGATITMSDHSHQQQQQKQYPSSSMASLMTDTSQRSTTSNTSTIRNNNRESMIHDAERVLDALRGGDQYLDGFNLLGVIASPTGSLSSRHGAGSASHHHHGHHLHMLLGDNSNNGGSHSMHGSSAHSGVSSSPSKRLQPPTSVPPPSTATTMASAESSQNGNNNSISSSTSLLVSGGGMVQSLEVTLAQVTEQLEMLTHYLEDWSRQILMDGDDAALLAAASGVGGLLGGSSSMSSAIMGVGSAADPDAIPESQLKELPESLRQLEDLRSLQEYLEQSGVATHAFSERVAEQRRQQQQSQSQQSSTTTMKHASSRNLLLTGIGDGSTTWATATTTTPAMIEEEGTTTASKEQQQQSSASSSSMVNLSDIPKLFFRTDFDLTEPDTFRALLLGGGGSSDGNAGENVAVGVDAPAPDMTNKKNIASTATDRPVHEWFQLPAPDAFGGCLDKVELALHQQVRLKSGDFFAESLRFAQLQEWIQELLEQVTTLQGSVSRLETNILDPMEIIPSADDRRDDLHRLLTVLERADEMIRCKGSLGGVLSAQDDLSAIEQIQYGRRLLAGTVVDNHQQNDVEDNNKELARGQQQQNQQPSSSSSSSTDRMIELTRLHALKGVSEQLNQYEKLVVTNLRDELVEIFLRWDTVAVASVYATTTASGSATTTGSSDDNNGDGNSTVATSGGGPMSSSTSKSSPLVRARVREIMAALKNCRGGALYNARSSYAGRLQDVIRMTVRTTVAEFASDATGGGNMNIIHASVGVGLGNHNSGVTAMTLRRFLDCLDMLFEQLIALLTSAMGVDEMCVVEGFAFDDDNHDDNDKNDDAKAQQDRRKGDETRASFASSSYSAVAATIVAIPGKSKDGGGGSSGSGGEGSPMRTVVAGAAELSSKQVSELLRLRKEAHSLLTLEEMKSMWDACVAFTQQIERMSGQTSALRSTLLSQAKAFVERKHESNMSALVAALDSERWSQCEVSSERQGAITRLCTGRAIHIASSASSSYGTSSRRQSELAAVAKSQDIEVEGTRYKVVWSCLLLVEMIMTNCASASHFSSLASSLVGKVSDLLRLFNSRTTQLVLGAGAIHSNARLKSINAKHLSLVTQCLGMVMAILPHIRAALMAQLPKKQHTLLSDLDQIRREYAEHNEKVLNKFVTIIGGIVEHGLAPKIAGTDFDARARDRGANGGNEDWNAVDDDASVTCCVFLQGIADNARKMRHVLLLPPGHLRDVFSRIFAYVDRKIPTLLISAAEDSGGTGSDAAATTTKKFELPSTDGGKRQLLLEVKRLTETLNKMDGVQPWDFTATNVLERRLEYSLQEHRQLGEDKEEPGADVDTSRSNVIEDVNVARGEPATKEGDDDEGPRGASSTTTTTSTTPQIGNNTEGQEGNIILNGDSSVTNQNHANDSANDDGKKDDGPATSNGANHKLSDSATEPL